MSTFPQGTVPVQAQSLTGSAIKASFAATGDGTGAPVGAYPRCIASGVLAVAGDITTMTVQLAVLYPGNADPIPIMSSKPNETTPLVEHPYTVAGDWCLLTSNHAGGTVYVQVKGDGVGSSGDVFTAQVQGCSP